MDYLCGDDQNSDANSDASSDENRGHRMNDPLDDQNLGVNRDRRMNGTDDRKTDENRVNRNCVLPDPKMGGTTGAMSRRVKLTGDPSMSCDRMSHDRLRYDHLTMRHRDTNRLDGKNPDVNHRMKDGLMTMRLVNWWKSHCVDLTIDPECYYPMMDVRMRILVMKSANYYRHDCLDVSLNY
jgi:hypothetical protein